MVHVDLRFCAPWDPAGKHCLGPPGSLAGPGAFLVSSEAPTFHQLRVTYMVILLESNILAGLYWKYLVWVKVGCCACLTQMGRALLPY